MNNFIEPIQALRVRELPIGNWLNEMKFDGYRALAFKTGTEVRLDLALQSSLDSMPYRGSKVKKRRGVLKLIHQNYLIYYRVNEGNKTVEVLELKTRSQDKIACLHGFEYIPVPSPALGRDVGWNKHPPLGL